MAEINNKQTRVKDFYKLIELECDHCGALDRSLFQINNDAKTTLCGHCIDLTLEEIGLEDDYYSGKKC